MPMHAPAYRIDWLEPRHTAPGRLGIGALPGRADQGRDLGRDLDALAAAGIDRVLVLLADDEFSLYGVDDLLDGYAARGIGVRRAPIADRTVPDAEAVNEAIVWIGGALADGATVFIHCVAGLGRSGTLLACYLRSRGLTAHAAITEVRRTRSPAAIETPEQAAFVRGFTAQR